MTLSFAVGISKDVCFSFDTPEIDDRLSSKNRPYCLLDYILTNAKINITMQISDAIANLLRLLKARLRLLPLMKLSAVI